MHTSAYGGDNLALKIAEAVDKRYHGLKSMQTDFVENYNGAGVQRSESGTLKLKQPGQMRWEYRSPREKLFVSDGKTAYFFVPGERQARKARIKNLDDVRSPLRFLLGKARLAKELDSLQLAPAARVTKPGNTVLSGVPRHLADRVLQVLLEINPQNQIERIVIEEVDGSATEFEFTDIQENPALADSLFQFKVPPGVELVDAGELTGE